MPFENEIKILQGDLSHLHIMVIGDVMIDRYMVGTSSRISPEAPVPVILWKRTENKLGGASNVAANLKAMGCKVSLMGLCGDDDDARLLENLLLENGIDHVYLLRDPERPTTIKTRIVAGNHQIARIDHEKDDEIKSELQQKGLDMLEAAFRKEKTDVLIIQDYNKGFLHSGWITKIMALARKAGVKIAVDPKKHHFFEFRDADLFKPNLKEALQMTNHRLKDYSDLATISKELKDKLLCKKLMITLASDGLWLDSAEIHQAFPTKARKVADVSGAGDTVISLAAIYMACSLSDVFMAKCCNTAGGQVCEKFGVMPVDKDELIHELMDSDFKKPN